MKNILCQTSDEQCYSAILQETQKINRIYADVYGMTYDAFLGIKRGYHPWQATYNRLPMLKIYSSDEELHWILYVDADAYCYDLSFDINEYFTRHSTRALIIGQGSNKGAWDVNAGVFAINLRHPIAQEMINEWNNIFMNEISDEDLRGAERPWALHLNDQTIIQRTLRNNRPFIEATHIESRKLINSVGSSFIRQVVRTEKDTIESRTERARTDIAKVLAAYKPI